MSYTCALCGTPIQGGLCPQCRLRNTLREENAKQREHQTKLQREQIAAQAQLQQDNREALEQQHFRQMRQQRDLAGNSWRIEAENKFAQAQKLQDQNLMAEALYLYQQVLLQDPSHLPALLEIAYCDLIEPAGVPRAEMAEKLLRMVQLPEWEYQEKLLLRSILYAGAFLPEATFLPLAIHCLSKPFKMLSDTTYARRGLPPLTTESVLQEGLLNRLVADAQHPRMRWCSERTLRGLPVMWVAGWNLYHKLPGLGAGLAPMAKALNASIEAHRPLIVQEIAELADAEAKEGWKYPAVWQWQWGAAALGTLPWAWLWFGTRYLPAWTRMGWAQIGWVGWSLAALLSLASFGAIARAYRGRRAVRDHRASVYRAEIQKVNEARLTLDRQTRYWPGD